MHESNPNTFRTAGNTLPDSGFDSPWTNYLTAESKESSSSSDDEENDGGAPSPTKPKVTSTNSTEPSLLDGSINDTAQSTTSDTTVPAPKYGNLQAPSSTRPDYIASKSGSTAKKLREEERRQALRNHQAFIKAVQENRMPEIKRLMALSVDVNQPGPDGYTALHHAVMNEREHLVTTLIENNADVTARTPKGYTPLMLAAKKRAATVVEILLGHVAQTDAVNTAAATNASSSSPPPRVAIGRFAQAAQLSARLPEADRMEAMLRAVIKADLPTAARMIAAGGMSLEESDEEGRTMLALAAINGSPEMIKLLLCGGAEIDAEDSQQNSPLMHAVKAKHAAAISVLMAGGAKTNQTNSSNQSASSLAIDSNDLKILQALLDGRADGWRVPSGKPSLVVLAARRGDVATTKFLLQRRAYLPDAKGSHTLAEMARAGELKAVKTLLQAGADLHHKDWDGHTAFTLAAANGQEAVVNALIAHCPANSSSRRWIKHLQDETDNQGRTALMLAVLNQKLNMAKLLLGEGADLHRTDHNGRNAMLWAAAKGNTYMVNMLIGHCATHDTADTHGNTVFLAAAEHGNTDVLDLFLQPAYRNSMFNMNSPNHDGDTPLIMAARKGYVETIRLLLKKGADVSHRNQLSRSAMLEAAHNGHREVLAMLQDKELTLPMVYPAMNTVLKEIVRIFPLISNILPRLQAPQTRQTDFAGNSMMHLVASHGHEALMSSLLAASSPQSILPRGHDEVEVLKMEIVNINTPPGEVLSSFTAIDIEATNKEGLTPLCVATQNGHYSAVKLLIEQGAGVNHADDSNGTPLWRACRLKECSPEPGAPVATPKVKPKVDDMVALLLAYHALPDQVSFKGQTPLIAASAAGTLAVVQRLVVAGANVNHADDQGLTPLMHASHFGHKDIVKTLLDTHALPDPLPGMPSALTLAAAGGHDEVVSLLIDRGAQTNHVDHQGATALVRASKAGKLSTVILLIERGADLAKADRFGNDAIAYARRAGHDAIVLRLQQGGLPPRDS